MAGSLCLTCDWSLGATLVALWQLSREVRDKIGTVVSRDYTEPESQDGSEEEHDDGQQDSEVVRTVTD